MLLVSSISGCTEVELIPGKLGEYCAQTNECLPGLNCVNHVCGGDQIQPDGQNDVVPDIPPVDGGPDPGPTDPGQDPGQDTEPKDLGEDGFVDLPDPGPKDVPIPPDTLDAGTDQGQDPGPPDPGPPAECKELDEFCDADPTLYCCSGLVCMPQVDGTNKCMHHEDGNCAPCVVDTDCPLANSKCMDFPGGDKFCGAPCTTECAEGFYCDGAFCSPVLGTCRCSTALLGSSMPCKNETPDGTCEGQTVCLLSGWTNCTAKPPSTEICDGIDNDCDTTIDEEPLYSEIGNLLPFGAPCGLGECVGGTVICTPEGGVTCSTNALAKPELCADSLDNDCNGKTDEADYCTTDDTDGDGFDDEDEVEIGCDPYDSGYYPGNPHEECCPPASTLTECDWNCDGSVTACAPCDTDFDGFCPPEDCGEGDPTIYPGAPEKCLDGIDQDCAGGDIPCPPGTDVDGDGYRPPFDCAEGNEFIHPYAEEECDNLDNDCDGMIDEGDPGGGAVCGTGPEYCTSGILHCTHFPGFGAKVECIGAIISEIESCDGKDNNCNGATDEDWPNLGQACDGPDGDMCEYGIYECNATGDDVICGQESMPEQFEECNTLDDDCDGSTDEGLWCDLSDMDGDGYTEAENDCNDKDAAYYPGAPEDCCLPGTEQAVCDKNCDGSVIPCPAGDNDGDGFTVATGDCDDTDPLIKPGGLECCGDGIDQDCVGGDLDCALIDDNDNDCYHKSIDCNEFDENIHPNAPEVCNFLDDDCDFLVDEGNPVVGQGACGPGGTCPPGEWVCVHDNFAYIAAELCINELSTVPEECNYIDDDCDGDTDETFNELGLPCDGPDSDLCEHGLFECNELGDGVTCGLEVLEDIVEVCNEFDDDCNGEIDDGLYYLDPALGIAKGDDCDGIGECGLGIAVCNVDDQLTCSTDPDGPFPGVAAEICDGADNDCDGETDEVFQWDGLAIGEDCMGYGVCGLGVVECNVLGTAATCSTMADGTASQASLEICDEKDNDCDGETDNVTLEGSPCLTEGVCGAEGALVVPSCVDGEWHCDYAGVPSYEEETELSCDLLDNDCNGETDEDFQLGEPCDGPDSDLCMYGTWTCAGDTIGAACDNETETDFIEICNDLDDDCDGKVDELDTDPVAVGCVQVGVCGQTEYILVYCGDPALDCDYSEVPGWEANETLCDLKDNDCDGFTDEGLSYGPDETPLTGGCVGKGTCGDGFVECNVETGEVICSTEQGGSSDQSVAELCDNLDNDCDGQIDEDYWWQETIPIGQLCDPPGEVCGTGVVECPLDGAPGGTCSTGPGGSNDQSSPEDCDGLDNDCDGETDEVEDLDPTMSPCKLDGVCSEPDDFVSCQMGAWVCSYGLLEGYEAKEALCDGLDNDCNGEIDDPFPLKGHPCDGDDIDECPTGTWTCTVNQLGLECTNETGAGTPEICDGFDNDCDGLVDNGMNYQGAHLGSLCDGIGHCGLGIVECGSDNVATCSSNGNGSYSEASEEVCNGIDDDCNGLKDDGQEWEGLPQGAVCDGTGECGIGVVECSAFNGLPTCSTNPFGSESEAKPEQCDGVDNNCNGLTDEEYPLDGAMCDNEDSIADPDECKGGVYECIAGVLTCVGDVACVANTDCVYNAALDVEECICGTGLGAAPCSQQHGDSCDGTTCTCAGGGACSPPNSVCTPTGCEGP